MLGVVIGVVAVIVGVIVFFRKAPTGPAPQSTAGKVSRTFGFLMSRIGGVVIFLFGLFLLASSSFVFIDANSVGHLKRIYAFNNLPPGRIIATEGEKGPQAEVLGPGFHVIPLVRVLYDVEEYPVITVPEGFYGQVTALDGEPMPEGMFIAPSIPDDRLADMLKAEIFLTDGGYRGPQETVLKPGSYRLNRYLFLIEVSEDTAATVIPAGHVGVVKSNVVEPGVDCRQEEVSVSAAQFSTEALSVPLVPRGCVGIWKEALLPGAYYLNKVAYEVTLVDTRVQTWEYKGGFTRRVIDLALDQQGNLRQTERTTPEDVPSDAADRAVFVKVEGWDIPLELRALVQVSPRDAPVVVGSVGGLDEIENRILTPAIRSIVRNVAGSSIRVPVKNEDGTLKDPPEFVFRPTRVLDLIENRDAIEQTIEGLIKVEGRKAGVEIKEIRIGEPAIPPELLLSRLRVQLADQLSLAYARETQAQQKRIETEQARSTADEQPRLVEAQIAVEVAKQREAERAALGRAERQFLEELARGQSAQAQVLGQDRVALLQALEKVLNSLEQKPELVTLVSRLVPHTVVGGDGGLAGAAAILGSALGGRDDSDDFPDRPGRARKQTE
jgi:hypothetical protein